MRGRFYSNPTQDLRRFEIPIKLATKKTFHEYGVLLNSYHGFNINQVNGVETETEGGIYNFWWHGNSFYVENEEEGSKTLLGWSVRPEYADTAPISRENVLFSQAKRQPDGGLLIHPLRGEDYIVPLAKSSNPTPEDFVAFFIKGGKGIYINPNIWYEGVIPMNERASFYCEQVPHDKQSTRIFSKNKDWFVSVAMNKVREQFYI